MRVIATTNRPLLRDVEAGRFREDLYYRLNVFPITVPPLRDRCGDIPMLARHFAQAAAKRNGLPVPLIPDEVVALLQQRPWKGNIRELENVIERAVLLASDGTVEAQHLLLDAVPAMTPRALPAVSTGGSTAGSLWEMERELIFQTLARVHQNRTKAATELGISIRTLRNKLREYRQGSPAPSFADR